MGGSAPGLSAAGTLRLMTPVMASLSTGSISTDFPPSWISQLACPSQVRRAPWPAAGASRSACASVGHRGNVGARGRLAPAPGQLVADRPLEDVRERLRPGAVQVHEAAFAVAPEPGRFVGRARDGEQGLGGHARIEPVFGGRVQARGSSPQVGSTRSAAGPQQDGGQAGRHHRHRTDDPGQRAAGLVAQVPADQLNRGDDRRRPSPAWPGRCRGPAANGAPGWTAPAPARRRKRPTPISPPAKGTSGRPGRRRSGSSRGPAPAPAPGSARPAGAAASSRRTARARPARTPPARQSRWRSHPARAGTRRGWPTRIAAAAWP